MQPIVEIFNCSVGNIDLMVCELSHVGQDGGDPRTRVYERIIVCMRQRKVLSRWWFFHWKPERYPSRGHMQDCWEAWSSTSKQCHWRVACVSKRNEVQSRSGLQPYGQGKFQYWCDVRTISTAEWRRWLVIVGKILMRIDATEDVYMVLQC